MRVVLVHDFYQTPGGEDVCFEQDAALLERRGHTVLRYTRHNREIRSFSPPRRLLLSAETVWSRRTIREIGALLTDFRPDVVHVHNFFPLISPTVFRACAARGAPTVFTVHNYRLLCAAAQLRRCARPCELCVPGRLLPGIRHRCYRNSAAQTAAVAAMLAVHRRLGTWRRSVGRYITGTEFSRSLLIKGGLPEARISVRPNFVEPAPPPGQGPRSGVVFVGRLSAEKGIDTLLDAWNRMPDIPLTILGAGPLESALKERLARASLRHVVFEGFLDRDAVLDRVGRARALVVPSTWYEVMPRVVLEAFAVGTPVLASRLGALAEIVKPDENGAWFEPGNVDDLVRVVRDAMSSPDRLRRWGARARQTFERLYGADTAYDSLMSIYRLARGVTAAGTGGLSARHRR